MSGLAQRITDLEAQIVAKRDLLEAHLDKMDGWEFAKQPAVSQPSST